MGTNYYWYECPPCPCCARGYASIHIGKSSAGWNFLVHVYPHDDPEINDLSDWEKLWRIPGSYIKDEYGKVISTVEMKEIITERKSWNGKPLKRNEGRGFLPGGGTWDYYAGEFS